MTRLSVVLITKDQAWNVDRLIDSVRREIRHQEAVEILLVDSASADETVARARAFPIRILRLRPDQRLTPAAGRYLGFKQSRGEFVLFLDGDMELYPGWLEQALRLLREAPNVAVVTGELIDLPKTAGERDKPPLLTLVGGDPVAVDFVGGAAIYRRSVLDRVGTFNPYLCSEEEPELALRIRHAGYRAVRLPFPIAYHYSSPSGAYTTMLGRWQRRLYLGPGQCIRYLLGTERFWPYLRARGWGLAPAVGAATGVASLAVSARTRRPTWIATWTALLALLVLGDAYRKRSLYRATASLLERTLILDGTVRGFLMTPHDPDRYPAAFDVIAEGPAEVEPPSLRRVTG